MSYVKKEVETQRRILKALKESAEVNCKSDRHLEWREFYRGKKEAYEVAIECIDEILKQIQIEEERSS